MHPITETLRKFIENSIIRILSDVQNLKMKFRLRNSSIVYLSREIADRAKNKYKGMKNGQIKFFLFPVNVSLFPEIREITEHSSEITYRIEFNIFGFLIWYTLHSAGIKRKINHFHNYLYFFSMKEKTQESYSPSFFRAVMTAASEKNNCSIEDQEGRDLLNTMILPFSLNRHEAERIIPPPFQVRGSEKEMQGFIRLSSDAVYNGKKHIQKLMSLFSIENSDFSAFLAVELICDDDFHIAWLEIKPACRNKLKHLNFSARGPNLSWCLPGCLEDSGFNFQSRITGKFGNGDSFPVFLSEKFSVIGMKKNFDIVKTDFVQTFFANRIYYVSPFYFGWENNPYNYLSKHLKCSVAQEGRIYHITALKQKEIFKKNISIQKTQLRKINSGENKQQISNQGVLLSS